MFPDGEHGFFYFWTVYGIRHTVYVERIHIINGDKYVRIMTFMGHIDSIQPKSNSYELQEIKNMVTGKRDIY